MNDVEQFERRAGTYERSLRQWLFFNRVHRIVFGALAPFQVNPQTILDIGCGTGRLLRQASALWPDAQLTGVDPAQGMVDVARALTPQGDFHVAPAEQLPLPDASVDLVLSTASFHHWQDQMEGLRQVSRVLRPGGYFLLADIVWPFGLSHVIHHGHPAAPPIVRQMFAGVGLNVKSQRQAMGHFLLVTVGAGNLSSKSSGELLTAG